MIKKFKYTLNLEDYLGNSPRINGFKKLKQAGLPIPEPIFVINQSAFIEYKKNGLTNNILKELETIHRIMRVKNSKKGIVVRRAYVVPGIESPPGPRSSSFKDFQILILEIKKIFDFAIKNKFDIKGSEISAFIHPHINPKIPLGGGCVTGEGHNGKMGILIEAIYGNDEGVQSFPHDDYILDLKLNRFIGKTIHYKNQCLSAVNQFEYKTIYIPRKLRNVQVFPDNIILKIARHYRKFNKIYGPHRLEFDVLKTGIFYIEATEYAKKETSQPSIQFSGKIVRVRTLEDINKIKITNRIIFVDPKVIKTRNMDLLTHLACTLPEGKVILYPGSVSTAHASIIFREMGHTIVYIGSEIFNDGEEAVVQIKDGELVARHQFLV